MGQLVHTLHEGPTVLGVTSLAGEIYLLRFKAYDQVEVYDAITYSFQRRLTVPNARELTEMASCEHYLCVYIGDHDAHSVHRLDAQGAITRWAVHDSCWGISVNAAHNVLVTFRKVRKIKEFTSHGDLLREILLPDDIFKPLHTIQTRSGQFIVCHGYRGDPVHRVCMMSDDGRHIVYSHCGQPGAEIGQCNMPRHLAVNDNEFVFVADLLNCRVTLLSPTLECVRQIVSRDQLKWNPDRLFLDRQTRHLYVADNDVPEGIWTVGRVVIFSV